MTKIAGNNQCCYTVKSKVGCKNLFEYYNPSNPFSAPANAIKNHPLVKPSAKMAH